MIVDRLAVSQFRSYDLFETALSPRGTVIVGQNGVGKTNLLEALYVSARGTSFRGSDRDMLQTGTTYSVIKTSVDGDERRFSFRALDDEKLRRDFLVGGKKSARLSPKARLPVVLFEPDELRLITSSPTRRREFFDRLIDDVSPSYGRTLRAFTRTLLQRNELLKSPANSDQTSWKDQLFAWNIRFVQLASELVSARLTFLETAQSPVQAMYNRLASRPTSLTTDYQSRTPLEGYEQALLRQLEAQLELDRARGFTGVGPHRDDYLIRLHDRPALAVASRGEMRSIMLAFKLFETDQKAAWHGTSPLLLLDDVFSELDAEREQHLQEVITTHQFVITTTDTRHQHDDGLIITITP